ncbi:hypothetical protein NDN08_003175 [Rhodosorus marinus]|uniref:tRNA-dihydrouridine(16/17) synthase [NAD(P)(+)] n=1 Tax=Rhodosorus marinus TaxID=101924 RepID=A0AAV8UW40_9RHOD|nr:hypothetical protein NDN08_003175 [Rhodosorus marinus]
MEKLEGYEFYRSIGSPKWICGPMVDASELAFRMLVRRYGVDLAYTPMLNSKQFTKNTKLRKTIFTTCEGDRPLVAQFAGDCPETLLEAAKLVECCVDAVDINFGCPQHIAKRGHYGAYLQDEWDLMRSLISTLHQNLSVPVWCKIRVFPELEKSVAYAQMIEQSGSQVLAVHGRTRDSKGRNAGPADWSVIREIKKNLSVPVIANGDAVSLEAAEQCLSFTGCDGVMAAYPLLVNPTMFSGESKPDPFAVARGYLDLAEKHLTPTWQIRGHIFKLLKGHILGQDDIIRTYGAAQNANDYRQATLELEERIANGYSKTCSPTEACVNGIQSGYVLDEDDSVVQIFRE